MTATTTDALVGGAVSTDALVGGATTSDALQSSFPWYLAGGIPSANCLAAYEPQNATTNALSYVNIANPGTYDLTVGNAPSIHHPLGWIFDGINDYLATGINGSATLSVIIRFAYGNPTAGYKEILGSTDGVVGGFELIPNYTTGVIYGGHGISTTSQAPSSTEGVLALTPSGIYLNGVLHKTLTANWAGVTPREIYIGCLNGSLGADKFYPGAIRLAAFYDIDIAPYIAALSTRMLYVKDIDRTQGPVWNRTNKYNLNGIVMVSEEGERGISEPMVIYDTDPQILIGETNVFKMWYSYSPYYPPTCGTAYAESVDGIIWTKLRTYPVLDGTSNWVVKVGATYYGYVCKPPQSGTISAYTSADGITWVLAQADSLPKGGVGAWDEGAVTNCCVWYEGAGDWRMVYEGGNYADLNTLHIGYATSADGLTWTKSASNPIIDIPVTACPTVKKVGSTYWIWCSQHQPTDIVRFRTTDFITITQSPVGDVFYRITPDEVLPGIIGQVVDQCHVEYNGKVYMFYAAMPIQPDGMTTHIKLAIADMTLTELVAINEDFV